MIGTLGEGYAGIIKYGTTDAEIFENLDNHVYNYDNLDTGELEEELVGGAV